MMEPTLNERGDVHTYMYVQSLRSVCECTHVLIVYNFNTVHIDVSSLNVDEITSYCKSEATRLDHTA